MTALISFVAVLLILVLVHEYGHFKAARLFGVAVEEFGFGFPPRLWQKRSGGTVYSINALPLGGFVRIKGEDSDDQEADSFSHQSIARRCLIVGAGVIMNLLLAVLLFTVGFTAGMPTELENTLPAGAKVRNISHEIVWVAPDSPASNQFQSGDIIRAIDEQEFTNRLALQAYIREHENKAINFKISRDGEVRDVELTPLKFKIDGQEVLGVGIQLFSTGTVSYPFYRAPWLAVRFTASTLSEIVSSFGSLITRLWQGQPVGQEVAGPVGIAVLSGEVAERGILFFIQFVALLSLNLAFINALPIPALDGGRFLFLLVEAIRGRPLSNKIEGRIHAIGFALLLMVVLVVTLSDVGKFSGWWGG